METQDTKTTEDTNDNTSVNGEDAGPVGKTDAGDETSEQQTSSGDGATEESPETTQTETSSSEDTVEETPAVVTESTQETPAVVTTASPAVNDVAPVSVVDQVTVPEVQPKETSNKEFTPVFRIELELKIYAEEMHPGKAISHEEGAKRQSGLYKLIMSILSTPNQADFNKEWNTLLSFFHQNSDGVFNEKYMFRFADRWLDGPTSYAFFRRIIYTIIQTANPATRRKAMESIVMERLIDGLTFDQKQKLVNFYA